MKKYIKQIILLALVVSFASCEDDVEIPMTQGGGNITNPGSISRLDNAVPLTFKIITQEGVAATAIEVYRNTAGSTAKPIVLGAKVSDATIGADGKTAVYNSSTLGSFDVFPVTGSDGTVTLTGKTGTFPLAVKTTFSNGTMSITPYVQTIAKGIVWKTINSDGDPVTNATSGVTSFKLNDPKSVNIRFAAVKKAETTISSIVGQWSKNGGAYTDLPLTFENNTSVQKVDVANIPYSTYGGLVAGDAITYKFIVTAGTQSDFITTKITVADQVFGGSSAGSISQDAAMNEFSFATGKNYEAGNKAGEIEFMADYGIMATATSGITFVVNSGLDYSEANLFDAKAAYNAGTPVTSVTDLAVSKVLLYKITRKVNMGSTDEPDFQNVTYYGLMEVSELTLVTTATAIQGVKFEYKEGILRE